MLLKNYILSLVFLLITYNFSYTQKTFLLKSINKDLFKNTKTIFKDSLEARNQIKKNIFLLQENGFLTASVDSIWQLKDTIYYQTYVGNKFKWSQLKYSPSILALKISSNKQKTQIVSPTNFVKLQKQILDKADHFGFPFAQLQLDSMIQKESTLFGVLTLIPNQTFNLDTITILGSAKLKQKFLQNTLGMSKGSIYKGIKIEKASQIVRNWNFVKGNFEPNLVFSQDKVYPTWRLETQKSNRFDGIIGVMPVQTNSFALNGQQPKRQILVTGELNLLLNNMFKSGKMFRFEWKQFKAASPSLLVEYKHPAFLGSKIDVLTQFSLLKNDSSFLNISRSIGIEYFVYKLGTINMSTGLHSSNISKPPANSSISKSNFGDFNSTQLLFYSLGLKLNKLDQIFNSKKGFSIELKGILNRKLIKKNVNTPDTIFNQINSNQLQSNVEFSIKKYSQITKKSIFVTFLTAKGLVAPNIFLNDLYRLGGNQLMRGFNENDFYANKFIVVTSEFRQYIDPESYFHFFYDQGFVQLKVQNSDQIDNPIGIGCGFNFSAKAGMFNFAYSLGNSKMLGQKIQFNQSRIHVGYVSRF